MNALRAAKEVGQRQRFIDFSTSEVFGSYAFRVREADVTSLGAVGEARWTYAVSKLATEHLAHNYWKQFSLPTCSIRPFNIYGPGQVGEGAIHAFVARALKNEAIQIHNEGDQIRSVVLHRRHRRRHPALPSSWTRPSGSPSTSATPQHHHDLPARALVVRLSGASSPIEFVKWDFPDVELRVPDVKKAERLAGGHGRRGTARAARRDPRTRSPAGHDGRGSPLRHGLARWPALDDLRLRDGAGRWLRRDDARGADRCRSRGARRRAGRGTRDSSVRAGGALPGGSRLSARHHRRRSRVRGTPPCRSLAARGAQRGTLPCRRAPRVVDRTALRGAMSPRAHRRGTRCVHRPRATTLTPSPRGAEDPPSA
jgi:hypothetical protein